MTQESEGFRTITDPVIVGPIIRELQQFKNDSDLANVLSRGLQERGVEDGWLAVADGVVYGPADYDGIFEVMEEAKVDPRYARVKKIKPGEWPPSLSSEQNLPSE